MNGKSFRKLNVGKKIKEYNLNETGGPGLSNENKTTLDIVDSK